MCVGGGYACAGSYKLQANLVGKSFHSIFESGDSMAKDSLMKTRVCLFIQVHFGHLLAGRPLEYAIQQLSVNHSLQLLMDALQESGKCAK